MFIYDIINEINFLKLLNGMKKKEEGIQIMQRKIFMKNFFWRRVNNNLLKYIFFIIDINQLMNYVCVC